jgi:hypothetical protein
MLSLYLREEFATVEDVVQNSENFNNIVYNIHKDNMVQKLNILQDLKTKVYARPFVTTFLYRVVRRFRISN